MDDRSYVIRDISRLNLRPEAARLAYQLAEKIEMPVAFIMDAPNDRNIYGRHPEMPNAYWCSIRPQTEQAELERLILGNLYHGIQEGKRYLAAFPNEQYLDTLNRKQRASYFDLLGKLNSVVLSLDSEFFLRSYGIATHWSVHEKMFEDRIEKLREYIKMRKIQPAFRWYREIEVCNLIDYGNYCRRGKSFRDRLLPIIRQVDPGYIPIIHKVEEIILDASRQYTPRNADKTAAKALRKLVRLFQLEPRVSLEHHLNYSVSILHQNGSAMPAFSFIPEDYDRQDVLIKCVREANYFLSLAQEAHNFQMPVAFVYLSEDDRRNAYSNPGEDESYIISFTTGLFYTVYDLICGGQAMLPNSETCLSEADKRQYAEKFLRFVIFFITAHEYAHILNGDCCPQSPSHAADRAVREAAADRAGEELLERCFVMQYRPKELGPEATPPHGLSPDDFLSWLGQLPAQAKLDYLKNCVEFREMLAGDHQILKDAISFAKGFLRQEVFTRPQ